MKNKLICHKLTKEIFEEKVKQHNPNLDIIGEYKNLHSPITYHCNVCNFTETIQDANNLYRGLTGCGCCSGRKIVKGINDLATTHPWVVPYFKDKTIPSTVSANSTLVVELKCPICQNEFSDKITYITNRMNICAVCSNHATSFGERVMMSVLNDLNIKYIHDNTTEWSKGYRYDFIINDIQTIVEIDGLQHTDISQKNIDEIKTQLATSNHYTLIRVPYYKSRDIDYLITSINDTVGSVIDLSNIDWKNVLYKTLYDTTLLQIVNLWNNNIPMNEISIKLHMGKEKIRNNLKVANRIGLINYNPKDNMMKTQITNLQMSNNRKKKKVMCLNDNRIFNSITDAEKFYGLKVGKSVGRVCNGERKSVKGLKFIFIKEN